MADHADVPHGTRSALLFTAIAVLIASAKGGLPTVKEFGEAIFALTEKVVRQGQVRR